MFTAIRGQMYRHRHEHHGEPFPNSQKVHVLASKNKIKTIKFPSGKKSFIFIGKRDEDGKDEPLLCFVDNQNHKLTWMNEEEVLNLEKLMPRLDSYFSLYLEKAKKVKEQNAILSEEMNRSLHD